VTLAPGQNRVIPGETKESGGLVIGGVAKFSGKIEFDVTPRNPKPGDSYTIKVYATNMSDKAVKIDALTVSTKRNNNVVATSSSPLTRDLAPLQKVLINEVKGTWEESTSWALDAEVTIKKDKWVNSVRMSK
jgi:hypothetical protein